MQQATFPAVCRLPHTFLPASLLPVLRGAASFFLPAFLSWILCCLILLQQLASNPQLPKTFPNILPLQDFLSLDSYDVCCEEVYLFHLVIVAKLDISSSPLSAAQAASVQTIEFVRADFIVLVSQAL